MDKTPAKIVLKDPKKLTPYAKNAKVHKQKDIEKLAGQIAAFGFDQPLVVDKKGVIIKGHKRREAALQLGLKQVPVIVSTADEYQNMANRLADNAVVGTEYDQDMLRFELGTLRSNDFDLNLTGMQPGDLEMHLAAMDAAPESPAMPRGGGTAPVTGGGAATASDGGPGGPGAGTVGPGQPPEDAADDEPPGDEPPGTGLPTGRMGGGLGQPVVSYNLVFDDDGQQNRWYDFLKQLKAHYQGDTIAARLDAFLSDQVWEGADAEAQG